MNVYLLRHAHALSLDEAKVETDEERPLSDAGHAQVTALAEALKRFGLAFDIALTSPLRRARETADGLTTRRGGPAVEILEELTPGYAPKKVAKRLFSRDEQDVLLVGHEPDMGQLAAYFIGDKDVRVDFAKGALACIEMDRAPRKGAGALVWLVTPAWLTALSGADGNS